MHHSTRLKKLGSIGALAWLAALALAGCGGGSGGGDSSSGSSNGNGNGQALSPAAAVVDVEALPPSAAVSVQALVDYQQSLTVSNDTEPLKVSAFALPTSDTAEPSALK